jgi:hypothetical protein
MVPRVPMSRHAWSSLPRGTIRMMAHYRRSAALMSALLLATLTLRCESQTFDLLPESGTGGNGNSGAGGGGGKTNSNKGGTSTVNSGGRASGGKNPGGQFGAGAPTLGGFPTISGGRSGVGQCASNDDCAMNTLGKYCNEQGFCVECTSPTQCMESPRNLCSWSGRCVQCVMSGDCKDPRPLCDMNVGACLGCFDDKNCKEPRGKCEPGIHVCVECYDNDGSQCPPERPVCNTQIYRCIECLNQSDCEFSSGASGWCDRDRNQCACDSDIQCKGSPFGPRCIGNHCHECGPPQYTCPDGQMCDQNGKCVMR